MLVWSVSLQVASFCASSVSCLHYELLAFAGNASAGLTTDNSGATARTASEFTDASVAIATEIAENEIAHVRYLRAAITAAGGTAVSCYQSANP